MNPDRSVCVAKWVGSHFMIRCWLLRGHAVWLCLASSESRNGHMQWSMHSMYIFVVGAVPYAIPYRTWTCQHIADHRSGHGVHRAQVPPWLTG